VQYDWIEMEAAVLRLDDERARIEEELDQIGRECPEFCVQGGLMFHCMLSDFTPRVS
jgi:hypothetical protein